MAVTFGPTAPIKTVEAPVPVPLFVTVPELSMVPVRLIPC